jgi:hypothetical protein
MPTKQPRLDQESLAQLGRELQAAHHTSEREPVPERQKELLLEWAVREALEAAPQRDAPPGEAVAEDEPIPPPRPHGPGG